jgi:SAM-dependent methyltransferase
MSQPALEPTPDSQGFYDALAAEFRAQDSFWDNPYDREIWRLEHDLIRPYLNHPGPLLDLGCGFYPHFAFAEGRAVVAGDISFGSLRVARDFGDESGQVRLVQLDARHLPFASSSMAYAIAGGELLNHLWDYPRVLRELHRVLRPGGVLLIQVGAKWCFDSFWAILDALVGNPLGYSVTRKEAAAFLRLKRGDLPVTWAVTPSRELRVWLLSIRRLKRHLREAGFQVRATYGANAISGLVPLPIQQESRTKFLRWLVSSLIVLDRFVGRLPPFRTFAGNVFLLCEATTGAA